MFKHPYKYMYIQIHFDEYKSKKPQTHEHNSIHHKPQAHINYTHILQFLFSMQTKNYDRLRCTVIIIKLTSIQLRISATVQSSDPRFRRSADCQKLGSPEPDIFTRKRSVQKNRSCFSASQNLFFAAKHGQHVFFSKKVQLLRSSFFHFSEVVFFDF